MKGKSTFLTDVSAETEHFLIKSGAAMTEEKNGVSPKHDLIFFHHFDLFSILGVQMWNNVGDCH